MLIPPTASPPLPVVAVAVAYSAQPSAKALVVAGIGPLVISTDLDAAQLAQMSRKADQVGKHPPYGFYLGAVAYEIAVDVGGDSQDLCKKPIIIRVTMRLIDRHIEVAKDMKSDPCRFQKVVAHYRHHTDADMAVFQRYALKVSVTLTHLSASSVADAYVTNHPRRNIARIAQTMIEPVLRAMDAARDAEPLAVDTPAEVEELESACTDHA